MAQITPNLSLTVWNELSDPYDSSQLVDNFVKIDSHDHSTNGGTKVPNGGLVNSKVTIGSTDISLGNTATTIAGLTSVTSAAFTGPLTGSVTGNVTGNITGNVSGSAGSVAAANVTGTTLASNVTGSSLTSVGTLANLTVTNAISGSVTGNAGTVTNGAYINIANTFTGTQTVRAASTQDSVKIAGRAGGTNSYGVTITPTTLTTSRTLTLPNVDGTVITTGDSGTVTSTILRSVSGSEAVATANIQDNAVTTAKLPNSTNSSTGVTTAKIQYASKNTILAGGDGTSGHTASASPAFRQIVDGDISDPADPNNPSGNTYGISGYKIKPLSLPPSRLTGLPSLKPLYVNGGRTLPIVGPTIGDETYYPANGSANMISSGGNININVTAINSSTVTLKSANPSQNLAAAGLAIGTAYTLNCNSAGLNNATASFSSGVSTITVSMSDQYPPILGNFISGAGIANATVITSVTRTADNTYSLTLNNNTTSLQTNASLVVTGTGTDKLSFIVSGSEVGFATPGAAVEFTLINGVSANITPGTGLSEIAIITEVPEQLWHLRYSGPGWHFVGGPPVVNRYTANYNPVLTGATRAFPSTPNGHTMISVPIAGTYKIDFSATARYNADAGSGYSFGACIMNSTNGDTGYSITSESGVYANMIDSNGTPPGTAGSTYATASATVFANITGSDPRLRINYGKWEGPTGNSLVIVSEAITITPVTVGYTIL